jgi:hypothetical protein
MLARAEFNKYHYAIVALAATLSSKSTNNELFSSLPQFSFCSLFVGCLARARLNHRAKKPRALFAIA